ncbi:polyprenyl synthetase family protein [Psychrobacillus sp.]|uniref:polyprenyl synthetase family protein n=1 Tax=Psychrobacillus sp. TaxID=1871623 RepID=UPI0028BE8636|nr:polyprenyl synthetase family protein [Psychrobacillus sp.]
MVNIESKEIRLSMESIIKETIQQQDLQRLLLSFVQHKVEDHYPFGVLCVFHYEQFAPSFDKEIYQVAAAIELLILSFDILDDIEDGDVIDKPWSSHPALSLNASTALLFLCTSAISQTEFSYKEQAIAIMEKYALNAIQGQHKDLLNICQNENDYMNMMQEKSGSLVCLACSVGSVIANGDVLPEIESYSKWMGVVGQINNDIMDLKSWHEKNDMMNKKYSLPIIYLLEYDDEELKFMTDYYAGGMSKEVFLSYQDIIQQKLVDTDAIKYALVIRNVLRNKIMDELQRLSYTENQIQFLQQYMK